MKLPWRRSQPTPPTNVHIEHADGSTTPLDAIYVGRDEAGIHIWQVIGRAMLGPNDTLAVDVLPGRTGIEFKVKPGV